MPNSETFMKKKLLLLNGSHSEIPLIKAARKLGYYVITTGNNGSLVGHGYADEYHYADFSIKEDILALANELAIDRICACANDFGALSAAYVSEQLNLPGHDSYDVALTLHHKDKFKQFAQANHVTTPVATSFNHKHDALSTVFEFPVMVKPVDLTGGKGISRVDDMDSYRSAVEHAFQLSPASRIVVEPFFEGTLHSFSTFVVDGQVVIHFSDNEYTARNPYLVSTSAAPAVNASKFVPDLVHEVENIASKLKLVNGIVHVQYLADESNFTILEVTRRCSGDLHPLPVSYALGIDWAEWIVRAEIGDIDFTPVSSVQTGFYGRHCITACRSGVVRDVFIDDTIRENIIESVLWWSAGDEVVDYKNQRLGVVVLRYSSMQEMLDKTHRIDDLICVRLDAVSDLAIEAIGQSV